MQFLVQFQKRVNGSLFVDEESAFEYGYSTVNHSTELFN